MDADLFVCEACTFLNESGGPTCELCNTPRPGVHKAPQSSAPAPAAAAVPAASSEVWFCEACTFANRGGRASSACEVCGTRRGGGLARGGDAGGEGAFTHEQLSERVWKIVEADRHGQFPFLYVVMGDDKCVVIDTGCDTQDYRAYLSKHINKAGLPYALVCTHVHFDHVSGNHRFTSPQPLFVAMGNKAQRFSENYAVTSLCSAHGCSVRDFKVSRWLPDGDVIFLDDANPAPENALHVIHTPGHTLDSISLFYPRDRRLFVGDLIYPYTAIPISAVGSNVKDYSQSIARLTAYVSEKESDGGGPVVLSCGHVEPNLEAGALQSVSALLEAVRAGALPPTSMEEDGVAQYSGDRFHVLIPLDAKWV